MGMGSRWLVLLINIPARSLKNDSFEQIGHFVYTQCIENLDDAGMHVLIHDLSRGSIF